MLSLFCAWPEASRAEPETPLVLAIRNRNWPEALRLVESGAAIMNSNAPSASALAMLANRWFGPEEEYELRVRFLHQLLELGADPFAAAVTDFYPRGDHSMVEHALNNADSRFADLLLTNRPSPARRTPAGDTALHLATVSLRTNVIDALLSAGFGVNQTNDDAVTALQSLVWVWRGSFNVTNDTPPYFERRVGKWLERSYPSDVAEFLLSRGAKLDAWSAAGLGMTHSLDALLRADPGWLNDRDGLGRTPLHFAAFGSRTNAVALLIRAGADLSVRTGKSIRRTRDHDAIAAGSSALLFACWRESAEVARLLLEAGASPAPADADGNTPLHIAARWGATNCAWLLVKARAPLEVTNRLGKTPLRVAVESGSFPNVELLLQAGARPETGPDGGTLLHVAADKGRPGDILSLHGSGGAQTIPSLLRGGIPVDARDGEGRTPLQRAVTSLNWKAMNLLLTNGADVNAVDRRGNSALHQIATLAFDRAEHESEAWKSSLTGSNRPARPMAQQQVRMDFWTNSSVTAWLLDHGANPNLTNHDGRTPLELACCQPWGYWDRKTATNRIVLLLKAGAKATLLSEEGRNLLEHVRTSAAAD